ncbi:MAG: hypothetical protein Q8P92_05625 [Candidatus Daviesbacteria bacterium]|nr:hypothetical protein [Candidatus Daviesbacteria bacterium]
MLYELKIFIIHELIHILLGLILFLSLSRIIKKYRLLFWAFLVSIFLDIDHLFDYFIALGAKLDINAMVTGSYFDTNTHTYIPLHSWELAVIMIILGWIKRRKNVGKFLIATGVGIFTHLLVDQTWYQPIWNVYFLISRFAHNFIPSYLW